MNNLVNDFIQKVIDTHSSGHAREHSYRPALKELFENISGLKVINEPKRSEYGAPDFVFLKPTTAKDKIVIAYAEAKDINIVLNDIEKSEQMERYYGYSNIILTNGLEFRFYKNGSSCYEPIVIGKLEKNSIDVFDNSFKLLEDTIGDFIKESKEPIKSGNVLAKIMAGKARRIRDNVKRFLKDENDTRNSNLLEVFDVIKKLLLVDLDKEQFADMYSQTLVYGLFVARYHDESHDTFSRQEARDLVPASNPFLRHFFDHIAGSSFDPRIEFIVNELCEEFTHADVKVIIHSYFKSKDLFGVLHESRDPIIHFYEDFLNEYDSVQRKKMGVFYTPLPVVRFIIRAVDDVLKKEFGLSQGLADSSKVEIEREVQGKKKKDLVHKVQVLDPATGTGTFLNEVILHIKKSFEGQEGRWSAYVNNELLPRLHGFEIMMASYTIAHLKLSSTIRETGAKIQDTRLGVYLTNSLEKAGIEEQTLFSIGLGKAITEESNQANRVKNELPIMVVIGNPPYSVSSQNKGQWIQDLIKDYKKDLHERKINLDDDYIKFIRLSESLIEKNGSGVVAMITNNSFIDGVTHRQMRKHLLETFDSIYIVDLHGNSKKKEEALDGGKDENVFNIMQGVSINIFVKKEAKKKELGKVYHTELYGKRENKFELLNKSNLKNIEWNSIKITEPNFFFIPRNTEAEEEYKKGFKLDELMFEYNSGIQSKRDKICFAFNDSELKKIIHDFEQEDVEAIRSKYSLPKDGRDWTIEWAKKDLMKGYEIQPVLYRPFDIRKTAYTSRSKGFLAYPRDKTFRNFANKENIALITVRQQSTFDFQHILATKFMIESGAISLQTKEWGYIFPLYLYPELGENPRIGEAGNIPTARIPNMSTLIARKIADNVGAIWYPVAEYPTKDGDIRLTPEDIFDYIYAVLHSPNYREKYKGFLKIDFPRVPYPQNRKQFEALVALGKELREFHLLEPSRVNKFVTTFSKAGSDVIEKRFPLFKDAKDIRTGDESRSGIYINEDQYFGFKNISKDELKNAYVFYIGGYQPAQKWLKDRQGRKLSNEDIEHYQKMIVVLIETDRIMKEINKVEV